MMELLINLLLFCVLCGCGLMFFIKSRSLAHDATALHQAVSIASSVAGVYETGDGGFTSLLEIYPLADTEDNYACIYLDKDFVPCAKENTAYYVMVNLTDTSTGKATIGFYMGKGECIYSIPVYHYTVATPGTAKEVAQ